MRKIGICLFVAVLFCSTCLARAKEFKFRQYADAGLDMRMCRSVYRVSNIPLSIRNIPIHGEDIHYCSGNEGPIEIDSVKIPHEFDWLSGVLGFEAKSRDMRIRLGAKTRFIMGNHIGREDVGSHQIAERNYTDTDTGLSKRGYGHALTYYGIEMKEWFTIEPYIEFKLSDLDTKDTDVYIEVSFRQFHLQAEGGYDRYDEFDSQRHDMIARINEINVYLGIGFGDDDSTENKLYFGFTFLNTPKTFSVAENAKVEYDPTSFFIGYLHYIDLLDL